MSIAVRRADTLGVETTHCRHEGCKVQVGDYVSKQRFGGFGGGQAIPSD